MTVAERMQDRTIIVTGAGAGIGQAMARRFSAEGGWVGCLDVDLAAARQTLASLDGPGAALACDVSDETSVQETIRAVLGARKGIDVVINNAGIAGPQEPCGTTPLDGWRRTLEVNLTGPFLMSRATLPALIAASGNIVNVASALAFIGLRNECAYGPTKAGVVQMTKGMALDYAGQIRVNCICPGAVRTQMIASTIPDGEDLEAGLKAYGAIHPLYGRLAWPEEIADAALFLASDDASLITGAALLVDGGLTAG
jgi:NAD(P)-dependent dehydrogenase (short-subunit alcohol dehydrogenase family)